MRAAFVVVLATVSWGADAFGVWKLNPARSTLAANQKTISLRIEPHIRGEVFTLETVTKDGRAFTSSTILYFDGKVREFGDSTCTGTQWSQHVDGQTAEIVRHCAGGRHIRLIRRTESSGVLVLEITEENPEGLRTERRVVLERR